MFGADSLVERHAVKPIQRISAQNIYVVLVGELVAEFLHLDRRPYVTLRPQEMHTFPENGTSRILYLGSLCR